MSSQLQQFKTFAPFCNGIIYYLRKKVKIMVELEEGESMREVRGRVYTSLLLLNPGVSARIPNSIE